MSSADSAPLAESQGVATINVNLLNLDVATFNFRCRNAVKEKDKLTQVELRTNQLLHKKTASCVFEKPTVSSTHSSLLQPGTSGNIVLAVKAKWPCGTRRSGNWFGIRRRAFGPRGLELRRTGVVPSFAFCVAGQVLHRLVLQSATTIVMMVKVITKLATIAKTSNRHICGIASAQPAPLP